MTLEPIHYDIDKSKSIYQNAFCEEGLKSYPAYYDQVGYNLPWIGYFVIEQDRILGVGGFVGKPENGRVEIAYGTSRQYEGQGVATFSCRALIAIARSVDPTLTITAKTAPEDNASTKILNRNGFKFSGIVQDHEIGDAWEWVYQD